jgi:hypothetical protein
VSCEGRWEVSDGLSSLVKSGPADPGEHIQKCRDQSDESEVDEEERILVDDAEELCFGPCKSSGSFKFGPRVGTKEGLAPVCEGSGEAVEIKRYVNRGTKEGEPLAHVRSKDLSQRAPINVQRRCQGEQVVIEIHTMVMRG